MNAVAAELERFKRGLRKRNPNESIFHRVVEDLAASVLPWYLEHEDLRRAQVLERLTEPDRLIMFRVSWQTEDGRIRSNHAWRVQHNNALGPYKGGLRFRKGLTQDVLKALAFEQTHKNSLTDLPMGGAKGGSDFNPKGKSDAEIMRFCQSFMSGLHRYIGEDVDVPAGDIGVGDTEIGYLFGQYMRLENRWSGVLTGKGASFGGSAVRTEATGYGCVYFCDRILQQLDDTIEGKRIAISGSGTVALYAAEKAISLGARVVSMSDSSGFIHCKDGLRQSQLEQLITIKSEKGRVGDLAERSDGIGYIESEKPWGVACEVAMPCATENEVEHRDACHLIENGVSVVCEGANMPLSPDAMQALRTAGVVVAPGKAANAGGVAVSGMELSQNAMRMSWSREKVDSTLRDVVDGIHSACVEYGTSGEHVDYVRGANIAGFQKVARAVLAHGVI